MPEFPDFASPLDALLLLLDQNDTNPFARMSLHRVTPALSWKEAVEAGLLHDVSEKAEDAGFSVPLALTDDVFHDLLSPPVDTNSPFDREAFQTLVDARLWEVLTRATEAEKKNRQRAPELRFKAILPVAERTGSVVPLLLWTETDARGKVRAIIDKDHAAEGNT